MKLAVKQLIKIEMLLSLGIVFFVLTEADHLASLLFHISFILLFVAVALAIRVRNEHTTIMYAILVATILSLLMGSLISGVTISFGSLVYLFVFWALICYIYILQVVKPEKDLCNFVMVIGLTLSAMFCAAYFLFDIQTEIEYLTMNFSNSNLLGMWLLQAVLFAVLGFIYYRNFLMKGICVLLAVAGLYLIEKSGSRNITIALLLGAAILILSVWRKRNLSKGLLALVVIFPLLFVFVYIGTKNTWENSELLKTIFLGEGKGLDARYDIWISSLYNIQDSWLIGKYYSLAGNVHNSHLVLLCSYGVVVLVMTMVYLYKVLKSINAESNSVFQKFCLIAFCVTIFMGNAEGALFSGALGLYIPACAFLLLARYDPSKHTDETRPRIRFKI